MQPPGQLGDRDPNAEVYIGRLPPGIQQDYLEAHIALYGAIEVRILEGKSCAFASFPSVASAEKAIQALNGLKLTADGEGIKVEFAAIKGLPKVTHDPKVFIGSVNPGISEQIVKEVCQQFGVVVETKILAKSSRPACAFVTFASFAEADVCIGVLDGAQHPLAQDGKVLTVRYADAVSRSTTKGAFDDFGVAHQSLSPMESMSPALNPVPGGMVDTLNGEGLADNSMQQPKVFIGSLPQEATEDFVWGMMAPFGDVVEARILRKPGTLPCGFVRFGQAGAAEYAVDTLADNGKYTVKFADGPKSGSKRPFQTAFQEQPFDASFNMLS